jgi:hypothetical protein
MVLRLRVVKTDIGLVAVLLRLLFHTVSVASSAAGGQKYSGSVLTHRYCRSELLSSAIEASFVAHFAITSP